MLKFLQRGRLPATGGHSWAPWSHILALVGMGLCSDLSWKIGCLWLISVDICWSLKEIIFSFRTTYCNDKGLFAICNYSEKDVFIADEMQASWENQGIRAGKAQWKESVNSTEPIWSMGERTWTLDSDRPRFKSWLCSLSGMCPWPSSSPCLQSFPLLLIGDSSVFLARLLWRLNQLTPER